MGDWGIWRLDDWGIGMYWLFLVVLGGFLNFLWFSGCLHGIWGFWWFWVGVGCFFEDFSVVLWLSIVIGL